MVDPFKVECNECEMTFCAKCNRLYHGHGGLDCEAFSRKMATQDDALSESYVAETSKPCPNVRLPRSRWLLVAWGLCHPRFPHALTVSSF